VIVGLPLLAWIRRSEPVIGSGDRIW
jgi:hypothetical protein